MLMFFLQRTLLPTGDENGRESVRLGQGLDTQTRIEPQLLF